jgi:hypothetical protein
MRCTACNHKFSSAWSQPSPGGSSAPGLFLIGVGVLGAIALLLFRLEVLYWPWILIFAAGFIGVQVLVAWSDCGTRGGNCPKCDTRHPVRPWSL